MLFTVAVMPHSHAQMTQGLQQACDHWKCQMPCCLLCVLGISPCGNFMFFLQLDFWWQAVPKNWKAQILSDGVIIHKVQHRQQKESHDQLTSDPPFKPKTIFQGRKLKLKSFANFCNQFFYGLVKTLYQGYQKCVWEKSRARSPLSTGIWKSWLIMINRQKSPC